MTKYPWLLWEERVWGMTTQLPVSNNLAGVGVGCQSAWLWAALPAPPQAAAVPVQHTRLASLKCEPSAVTPDLDLVLGDDPTAPRSGVRPALPWWHSRASRCRALSGCLQPWWWHVLHWIQLISEGSHGDRTRSDVSKAALFSWCVYQCKKTKSTILPIISPAPFLALIVQLIP